LNFQVLTFMCEGDTYVSLLAALPSFDSLDWRILTLYIYGYMEIAVVFHKHFGHESGLMLAPVVTFRFMNATWNLTRTKCGSNSEVSSLLHNWELRNNDEPSVREGVPGVFWSRN
jgi:hypothetical protein